MLRSIADYVFSPGMFAFVVVAGFICTLVVVAEADAERVERTQRLTESCYSQGMVLIDTDAGQRCADPRSLVKVD